MAKLQKMKMNPAKSMVFWGVFCKYNVQKLDENGYIYSSGEVNLHLSKFTVTGKYNLG